VIRAAFFAPLDFQAAAANFEYRVPDVLPSMLPILVVCVQAMASVEIYFFSKQTFASFIPFPNTPKTFSANIQRP
jgi:hypothetical protein